MGSARLYPPRGGDLRSPSTPRSPSTLALCRRGSDTSSQTFRFKTRLQRLNSMEASARASLNFLEQLYIFHRQQGSSGISVPTIGDKPLDLWKLKREVTALGGYVQVLFIPCASRRRRGGARLIFGASSSPGHELAKMGRRRPGHGVRSARQYDDLLAD